MSTSKSKRLMTTLSKATIHTRGIALILSLAALPVVVQAATYQTYVIHTYGGDALLPAVRQQLSSSRDGGTVTTYQDKLVLNTTAANYKTVQQLLSQIDTQPQALTVAVRIGNSSNTENNIQQGQVIINNRGIQGTGVIQQSNSQQQNNSLYQLQTLSGSAASISTGTLWSLTQNYTATVYPSFNRPSGQIIIQQQVLLPTTKGIQVIPRLLANGQVEVQLSQVEEALVTSTSSYNRNRKVGNNAIERQSLNSTIIVPRGQWVSIGQITQSTQNQGSGYAHTSMNNSAPIQLLVQ